MKKPYKILYHSFTDRRDNWHETLKEAKAQIKEWKKEGEVNLRIYKETYDTKEEYEEGGETVEDCVYSVGAWPL
jgi:hypothetical protein